MGYGDVMGLPHVLVGGGQLPGHGLGGKACGGEVAASLLAPPGGVEDGDRAALADLFVQSADTAVKGARVHGGGHALLLEDHEIEFLVGQGHVHLLAQLIPGIGRAAQSPAALGEGYDFHLITCRLHDLAEVAGGHIVAVGVAVAHEEDLVGLALVQLGGAKGRLGLGLCLGDCGFGFGYGIRGLGVGCGIGFRLGLGGSGRLGGGFGHC